MKKILVVDDEKPIPDIVKFSLTKEGFEVITAFDGEEGLVAFNEKNPDLVILDLMLPQIDGLEVCREIRKTSNVPIIMVTAKDSEIDKVLGLELGADDYVIKPFSPRELMLRINAILQRTKRSVFYTPELYTKDVLVFPGLIIDVNSHKVIVEDSEVLLTPKEFDLLLFLAKSPDKAFKRNEILRAVWDYDFYSDLRTVDTHIKRVRKKFDKISPIVAQMIVTVWGIGYKFDTSQNSL